MTLLACVWMGAGAEVFLFIDSKWKRRKKVVSLDLMTLVSGPSFGCGLAGLCLVVSLDLGCVTENRNVEPIFAGY